MKRSTVVIMVARIVTVAMASGGVVLIGDATALSVVSPPSEIALSAPKPMPNGIAGYRDVVVEDVTGDGRSDVVATGSDNGPKLVVYRQKADGGLHTTPTIIVLPQTGSLPVAAGDYDGDGDTDIAVGSDSSIEIFGQSAGSLVGAATISTGNPTYELETADTDADGRDDLVGVEETLTNAAVVTHRQRRDGSGFRGPMVVASSAWVRDVAVGDADGDGRDDVLPDTEGDLQRLYLQQADGSFALTEVDMGESPGTVATGDVNSDGHPDLVASNHDGIAIRRGLGDGTWAPAEQHFYSAGRIALDDFDGNGATDLALVSGDPFGGGILAILAQDGNGTLAPLGCRFSTAGGISTFGDLDADALPDVATAGSDRLSIQRHLDAGEHRDATLDAWFVNNGPPHVGEGFSIGGERTVEDRWCKPSADVELWGAPPGAQFQRLGQAPWQGHPLSSTSTFAGSVVVDQAGIWTFEARWDGGRMYGHVRSTPVVLEVFRAETSIGLRASESAVTVGREVTLTASIGSRQGALPEGQPIDFFTVSGQQKTKISTVVTDGHGIARLTVRPRTNTKYVAEFSGTSQYEPASIERPLLVYVHTKVSGRMIRERRHDDGYAIYSARKRVFFRTTVEPSKAGRSVDVYLYARRRGAWRFVAADDYELARDSSITLFAPGRAFDRNRGYRFQAVYNGDSQNLGAESRWAYFKVD